MVAQMGFGLATIKEEGDLIFYDPAHEEFAKTHPWVKERIRAQPSLVSNRSGSEHIFNRILRVLGL